MRIIDGDLLTDIINETIEETKLLNRSVVTKMVIDFYRDFITIIERQPTIYEKMLTKCAKSVIIITKATTGVIKG